jgi:hypothetical protein
MAQRRATDPLATALLLTLLALVGPSLASWLAAAVGVLSFPSVDPAGAADWRRAATLLLKLCAGLLLGAGLAVATAGGLRRRFPSLFGLGSAPLAAGVSGGLWLLAAVLLLPSWLRLLQPASESLASAVGGLVRVLCATAAVVSLSRALLGSPRSG